ncbi:hypothetical protein TELCIR_17702 [Teladorsagia circumcincta]|uniref:Uncharacterized protein n=1 Tax=Teladorsagia circumcincta TaxID=45464 RepID=A0A2G9TS02_TELCI|nr:hypothetical protein TELCIR_17702 [Teladorsagia circumcincta]
MHLTGTTAHNHSNVKDQHECRKLGEGQNVYTYNVLIDPETNISHCYRTPVHFYVVTSPAFLIDDYKFSNSTYSTWTKAMYSSANLQLFLIEYESLEDEMLYVGMAFLVLSFLVSF